MSDPRCDCPACETARCNRLHCGDASDGARWEPCADCDDGTVTVEYHAGDPEQPGQRWADCVECGGECGRWIALMACPGCGHMYSEIDGCQMAGCEEA
jgi:hypothetical protein